MEGLSVLLGDQGRRVAKPAEMSIGKGRIGKKEDPLTSNPF